MTSIYYKFFLCVKSNVKNMHLKISLIFTSKNYTKKNFDWLNRTALVAWDPKARRAENLNTSPFFRIGGKKWSWYSFLLNRLTLYLIHTITKVIRSNITRQRVMKLKVVLIPTKILIYVVSFFGVARSLTEIGSSLKPKHRRRDKLVQIPDLHGSIIVFG